MGKKKVGNLLGDFSGHASKLLGRQDPVCCWKALGRGRDERSVQKEEEKDRTETGFYDGASAMLGHGRSDSRLIPTYLPNPNTLAVVYMAMADDSPHPLLLAS